MQHVLQEVEEESSGPHETGVDGTTHETAERVPSHVVEPVVEVVEAFLGEIFRAAEVEPRVELVNHTLVSNHGKETNAKCKNANCCQDDSLHNVFTLARESTKERRRDVLVAEILSTASAMVTASLGRRRRGGRRRCCRGGR